MYRWELDGPAQREFAELPPAARASLAAFMDAVAIVDPVQYQRRRDERDDVSMPLRSLHFGPPRDSVEVLPNGPGDTENPQCAGPGDQGDRAGAGRDQVIDSQAHECVGGAGWH